MITPPRESARTPVGRVRAAEATSLALSSGLSSLPLRIGLIVYLTSHSQPIKPRAHPTIVFAGELVAFAGMGCAGMTILLSMILLAHGKPRTNEPAEMSITPEGLVESRSGVVITTKWRGFSSVEQTPRVLILKSGDIERVVIPKRLFGSASRADEIFQMLQGYIGSEAIQK